jgi:hypothetical protein
LAFSFFTVYAILAFAQRKQARPRVEESNKFFIDGKLVRGERSSTPSKGKLPGIQSGFSETPGAGLAHLVP